MLIDILTGLVVFLVVGASSIFIGVAVGMLLRKMFDKDDENVHK